MSQELSVTIRNAERLRCTAMLQKDLSQLDGLLDERLIFAHATGMVDDKCAYMAKMAAGRIDYIAIDWPEAQVIGLGAGHALLAGRMATHLRVDGTEKQLDNRVTAIWGETAGAWRMLTFQSTPIKA
ncbi:nuclear transport factor 2 family protein [Sphingomonas sp. BIUV-7]|uniref:Nuclear transport factor 2 family protein n=1 Tax=Sphingomonas natans TaxID=3063330 RepID=A0ABT8Y882_9SPHN|nr:nuclear transport factor 2 family protein [Sphingomonas sp. BIUV-7]MDO6414533.1 nuclear transport factor 2 family protein [Sphingomonas sp. BIUV-7]